MPYIGRSTDGFGVRNRFLYLASANDTSVSGADANGATLTFTDGAYVDVYLNGVLLKAGTDYNTNTANTIASLSAMSANDEVTVVVYDVFTVADMVSATSGGTFVGNVTHSGTVTFGSTVSGLDVNGTEVILDADADTSITADTDDVIDFKIGGTDRIQFTAAGGITTTPSAGGNITINEGGVDADFRIESDNDVYAFFLNGANGHASIGSNNADYMGSSNTSGVLSLTVPSGGYAVFELAAEGADSANALAGTINFINTLQTGGNQLINIRGTTEGGTSADRGGRFSVGTKADGGSSPIERMKLISTGFLKVRGGGGDYIADTGEYHEFIGTASGSMPVRVAVQNSSYSDHGFSVGCTTVSSNAYSIISAFHGNGSSDAFSDRMFTVDGRGGLASDHSTSITSGADYAEYFEWKDGNSSSEDRIGQSVVLDGNQIRKATSDDSASNILGVISGNPSVVGDTAELRWQGKYELDDFNRRKTEEVEVWEWTDPEGEVDEIGEKHPKFYSVHKDKVPDGITVPSDKKITKVISDKESSSYDASKKDDYVPRKDRKEWDAVGMMGKLRMLKGQPTGDRWIKMRDISDTVEEWLVR